MVDDLLFGAFYVSITHTLAYYVCLVATFLQRLAST
jgi:hypothetical protein